MRKGSRSGALLGPLTIGICLATLGFAASRTAEQAATPSLPDYVRLDLELRSEKPAVLDEQVEAFQLPLRVHLAYEPGKPLRQFWFSRPRVNEVVDTSRFREGAKKEWQVAAAEAKARLANRRHLRPLTVQRRHLDVSQLTCDAERVKGPIGYYWRSSPNVKGGGLWTSGTLTVDLTIAQHGSVSGSFTRVVVTHLPLDGPKAPRTPGDPVTETGTVTGRALGWTELQRRHGIGAGKNVLAFPGNVGSTGFPSYDGELIEREGQARLVWVSEDNTALSWRVAQINFGGGYAPPLLWRNRIYQYYFQPKPGGTIPKSKYAKYPDAADPVRATALKTMEAWNVREAQEVVVCIDAATGATIWKRVMDFEGARNYGLGGSKSGPFSSPCVSDGRLFVQGTVGQLYCLDALTGETIWEDGKAKFGRQRYFALNCIDGVLLAGGRHGLLGIDPTSGKELWLLKRGEGPVADDPDDCVDEDAEVDPEEGGGSKEFPGGAIAVAPWTHDGKTYFVDGGGLSEARTGKRIWRFPAGTQMNFPMVHGDIALIRVAETGSGCRRLRAFRLALDGPKELWVHPDGAALGRYVHPCVAGGRVYGGTDNGTGGSSRDLQKQFFNTDLKTGETVFSGPFKEDPFPWPGMCLGVADGLIMGNGSSFARVLPEPPYMAPFGVLGYRWNSCMMPIYSDGRWFKRTEYGYIVCIDMRHPRSISDEPIARAFEIASAHLAQGSSTLLSWETLRGETVRIEPGIGAVKAKGTASVRPEETTTYTLTVEGKGDKDTKTVEVTVYPLNDALDKTTAAPGLTARFFAHEGGPLPASLRGRRMLREETVPDFSGIRPEPRPAQAPPPAARKPRARSTKAAVPTLDGIDEALADTTDPLDGLLGDPAAGSGRKDDPRRVAGFTGYVRAPADGLYEFSLRGTDEAAVYVARKKIAWMYAPVKRASAPDMRGPFTGRVGLRKGLHRLALHVSLVGTGSGYEVTWRRPGSSEEEPIPADALFH